MAEDEKSISSRTATFKSLVDGITAKQVEQRFKSSGRDMHGAGGSGDGEDKDDTAVEFATKLGQAAAGRDSSATNIISQYTGEATNSGGNSE